jgi:hypothetical protein
MTMGISKANNAVNPAFLSCLIELSSIERFLYAAIS